MRADATAIFAHPGEVQLLGGILAFSICFGILMTRRFAIERQRRQIARRLALWQSGSSQSPSLVTKSTPSSRIRDTFSWFYVPLEKLLVQAGLEGQTENFLLMIAGLLLLPSAFAFALGLDFVVSLALGVVVAVAPFVFLLIRRSQLRTKFIHQLPDAIDLMVSVLRSGHSVPQAVKSVGQELPQPLGGEFASVLQRMNLGQPLSSALGYSAERYNSYELDLIRRAVAIQAEVGGSLADLMEKTNLTLRQRLKLLRQVRVLTAQSRLTAVIVGLLPVVLAFSLQAMSPGYLTPLVSSSFGQTLLVVAVALEILGLVIMRRMSSIGVKL